MKWMLLVSPGRGKYNLSLGIEWGMGLCRLFGKGVFAGRSNVKDTTLDS